MTETDSAPRRVLVTGAGGFIGSHLAADQLRRGHDVVAVDLDVGRIRHLEAPRFAAVEGDIGDPRLQDRIVRGVHTVFHLAAAHLSVLAEAGEYHRVNVEAVRELLAACGNAAVKRFVHCSTVGVYGTIENPPADEATACHPEISYERTKLEGEKLALEAHRTGPVPVSVIRPVWVYGPGCARTEKLFRSIGNGRFVMAGDGHSLRHCVYIRDLIDAFNLAAASERAPGQVIIVGDDEAVPVNRLLTEIADLTGAAPPRSIPVGALYAVAIGAEAVYRLLRREPPLSRRTLKFFIGNTSFRIERAKQLLGFRPIYTLSAGLAETHRHLQEGSFWQVPLPDSSTS